MIIRKAYTLVEILIVIGLVLVLSTIIITVINPGLQQDRSKDAVIQKAVSDIAGTIEIFKSVYGRYPNESDTSLLQAYVSNGYTVYNYGSLLGFSNPNIENGTDSGSIYWDPADSGCLQSPLNETAGNYSSWVPGTEVQVSGSGCSGLIAAVPADADGPAVVGGGGAAGSPAPPVGSEYNQSSGNPRALMAYFKMDEPDGSAMVDSSGRSNNGVFTGGALHDGRGVVGTAIKFETNDQLAYTNSMLGSPRSATISAWVNPTGIGTSQGGEVISLGDNFAIRIRTNDIYGFYHDGTTWPITRYNVSLLNKGWVHLAFVFDDSVVNSQILYINGQPVLTTNHDKSIVYSGLGVVTSMGRHGNPTVNAYNLRARLDEVKVYNYVRTDAQILEEYESTKLAEVNDPILHFALDEASGDTATDSIAPAQNGNLASSQTCPGGSACPTWIASSGGVFNGAMTFDGDDHVDIGSGMSGITTSQGTFSAWFKTTTPTLGFMVYGTADSTGDGFGGNREGHLGLTPTGAVNFFMYGTPSGGSANISSPTSYSDGQWHHALATWSLAGGEAVLYVDGVEVASGPYSQGNFALGTRAFLGRPATPFGSILRAYEGDLDEVRIFDYALTPEQANAEYRR